MPLYIEEIRKMVIVEVRFHHNHGMAEMTLISHTQQSR